MLAFCDVASFFLMIIGFQDKAWLTVLSGAIGITLWTPLIAEAIYDMFISISKSQTANSLQKEDTF
ncbi:MAG: hypothetical protein HYW90_03575 [Candidatus Sungbacteria bacterium]|nr:hypothetical protein [Candidatus Sungbacteria bacterium]